jgi:copper transport protein
VSLQRAGGAPLAPSEVWLEMAQEAAGVAPIRRRMRPAGSPGRFVHEGRELALPGRWAVRVEALIGDFDLVIWTAVVDVGGPGR